MRMTFARDNFQNALNSRLPTDLTPVLAPLVPSLVVLVSAFMSHRNACAKAGMRTD